MKRNQMTDEVKQKLAARKKLQVLKNVPIEFLSMAIDAALAGEVPVARDRYAQINRWFFQGREGPAVKADRTLLSWVRVRYAAPWQLELLTGHLPHRQVLVESVARDAAGRVRKFTRSDVVFPTETMLGVLEFLALPVKRYVVGYTQAAVDLLDPAG
jgi:hypothetical protein